MSVILQLRKDISTAWVSANPVLAEGEVGLETDTRKIKVGDGVHTWTQLPYWTDASILEKAVKYNGSTAVGSATQGVYVAADGIATAMTYELNTTVPSDAVFTDTTYSDFVGADGTSAGGAGLVPAPTATDNTKYLKGDGTWANVPAPNNGTLTIQVNGEDLQTFSADQSTDVIANILVPDSATWGNITGTLANQTDLQSALDSKVDKTNTADRVYGTDAQGNQTTYDKNSFGQVDDVTVGGISVVTNKIAVLGSMAGEIASDYSTTTVANTLYAAKSLESTVSGIEAKIPSDATAQNQLADKDFVNSSIATQTANFIGTFDNESSLEAYSGTVTNNDYAFVINSVVTNSGSDWATFADLDAYSKTHLTNMDYAWVVNGSNFDLYRFDIVNQVWELRATAITKESVSLNTAYNRYKAVVSGSTVTWTYEYTLNNSSFTAQQWAAINSGITSSGVAQISTNETNIGNLSTLTTTAKTDLVSAINELDSDKQDNLPSQSGQSGKFLTTNGTTISWGNVDLSGYVTLNTAQNITETKTFTTQQKFQSGQGDGCLVIGADVASNTVTANTRKLGRMVFHTNESTTLNCAFVSTDTQSATSASVIMNCVEFGGRPADTSSTSPDIMNFTVAKFHNATAVADKIIALALTKDDANFAVQPKYNGNNLITLGDVPIQGINFNGSALTPDANKIVSMAATQAVFVDWSD